MGLGEPINGIREAVATLKEAQVRAGEDRREIWREQGRTQERQARIDEKVNGLTSSLDRIATKVDSLGKLAWGILAAVVMLLLGVIANLVLIAGP